MYKYFSEEDKANLEKLKASSGMKKSAMKMMSSMK